MPGKEAEALANCTHPNCCRKAHASKEQNVLTGLNLVKLQRRSAAEQGDTSGTRRAKRRPDQSVPLYDLSKMATVADLGYAWETVVPLAAAAVEALKPQNLSNFTPESQRTLNAMVSNARRSQTLRTIKLSSCPYR